MFDTAFGLPLHVLVLHAAVIVIPIGALAAAAVHLRGCWRARWLGPAAAVNVALAGLAFLTVRAGHALQDRLHPDGPTGTAADHQELGNALLWVVAGLALVSVLTWGASRLPGFAPPALTGLGLVVTVLALFSTVLTIVTGHTGAESHWGYLSG